MTVVRMSAAKPRLIASLAALDGAGRDALVNQWRDLVGRPPPPHTSVSLLRSVIAYELQTAALGTVPKRVERVLAGSLSEDRTGGYGAAPVSAVGAEALLARGGIIDDVGITPTEKPASRQPRLKPSQLTPKLAAGTQLVREWNGRTWQVEVVNGGFVCKGKRYRSLSAIAKMITGAHWSGPRFFGLRP
ncbi:DUF2924 domain-containing protein [Pseudahrensia aquimaris]|uniref:DUF2924 domain-containing protein n=1 Tax=Pseudahrensia aquimaris TaxID=744461 RepID=A0ABW3FDH1_9HYPH